MIRPNPNKPHLYYCTICKEWLYRPCANETLNRYAIAWCYAQDARR